VNIHKFHQFSLLLLIFPMSQSVHQQDTLMQDNICRERMGNAEIRSSKKFLT